MKRFRNASLGAPQDEDDVFLESFKYITRLFHLIRGPVPRPCRREINKHLLLLLLLLLPLLLLLLLLQIMIMINNINDNNNSSHSDSNSNTNSNMIMSIMLITTILLIMIIIVMIITSSVARCRGLAAARQYGRFCSSISQGLFRGPLFRGPLIKSLSVLI